MEKIYSILLFVHILSGSLALLAAFAAIVVEKGKRLHMLTGNIYFWGMVMIFFTAIPMSILSSNAFLFVIAIFSFYLAFSGRRFAVNRNGQPQAIDWFAVSLMNLSGVSMITLGILGLSVLDSGLASAVFDSSLDIAVATTGITNSVTTTGIADSVVTTGIANSVATTGITNDDKSIAKLLDTLSINKSTAIVMLGFGPLALFLGLADIKTFIKRQARGKRRIAKHLTNMLGGTIAVVTAVMVVNIDFRPEWVVWLLPTVLITPLIIWWNVKVYKGRL